MKIRKTSHFYLHVFLSLIVICYAVFRFSTFQEAYKISLEIFLELILVLGLIIKVILANFFPEIILTENGIKFRRRNIIPWMNINDFEIRENSGRIILILIKANQKLVSEIFKDLNLSKEKLQEILRYYLKKYNLNYTDNKI